jgi:hypothetical protein
MTVGQKTVRGPHRIVAAFGLAFVCELFQTAFHNLTGESGLDI